MITLTRTQARLVMLKAQYLLTPMEQKPTMEDVLKTIRDMGALQIDAISVVARSPYFLVNRRLLICYPRCKQTGHYANPRASAAQKHRTGVASNAVCCFANHRFKKDQQSH